MLVVVLLAELDDEVDEYLDFELRITNDIELIELLEIDEIECAFLSFDFVLDDDEVDEQVDGKVVFLGLEIDARDDEIDEILVVLIEGMLLVVVADDEVEDDIFTVDAQIFEMVEKVVDDL